MLGAADVRRAAAAIVTAKKRNGGVVWGIGAHVVKTGLSPVLIDLMERGYVSALAMNGAGIIHDFEVALAGATSEDVDEALGPGRFGMAEETGTLLNEAIRAARAGNQGLGQGVASFLANRRPEYGSKSLAVAAHHLGIPLTCSRRGSGPTSFICTQRRRVRTSARRACATFDTSPRAWQGLTGGVYLNCGSAVILPEVFLKAVALARNQGASLEGLTTVNIDFLRMYRAQTNVVTRPVAGIGTGISLVGHHEILIPLIAAAVIELE
jgi:hypothetical protein